MLIFGSSAMKYWWKDYPNEPKDVDMLSPDGSGKMDWFLDDKPVEFHWCKAMEIVLCRNKHGCFVDKDFLYTIKVSHLPWEGKNGKWWKHLKDAVFMQEKGCNLDMELLAALQEEWSERFGSKDYINLNKTVKEFFNSNVERVHNHDWVHQQFKLGEVPAYTLMQKDNSSAQVSKELFDSLTEYQKLCTVFEEMQVIAFERNITLPNAYKALVTRLSKGWWNLYCIESAKKVLDGFVEEKVRFKKIHEQILKEN